MFGGEGLFFAKMTGPGKVYLQSLPFARLVDRIKREMNPDAVTVERGHAMIMIVGEGPLKAEWEDKARGLGIERRRHRAGAPGAG